MPQLTKAPAGVPDMSDLKDLESLSQRINPASDELSQTLQAIENRLNALSLGVEAFVELSTTRRDAADDDSAERIWDTEELGYGRLSDGWALLVRDIVEREENDNYGNWSLKPNLTTETERRPLLRASRAIRVKAVAKIPGLIDAIKREAEAVIKAVEAAKKIADSLLSL